MDTDLGSTGAMQRRPRPAAAATEATLRILATTDLHAQMLPVLPYADRPASGVGLSRLASLIAEARREMPGALLFDNGDFLTGGALADDLAARGGPGPDRPHPMILAMNHLAYDAVGLGNHEFSHGLPYLDDSLAAACFPVVSANVRRPDGRPAYATRLLLHRQVPDGAGGLHPVVVGVTAALPPQTAAWERDHLAGRIVTGAILAAVRAEVRALRREGADVVVVLAHSGVDPQPSGRGRLRENAAQAVAALAGVDAVIAGHTHDLFSTVAKRGGGGAAALVLPGALGSHLGVIDLRLGRRPGGRWRVLGRAAGLRPVMTADGPVAEDVAIAAIGRPLHAELRQRLDRVVGHTPVQLDTHFALVRDCAALHFVGRAMQAHVKAHLDPALDELPVLPAIAPARSGGRGGPENFTCIPPGPLKLRHAGDLFPFPDRIVALELRGDGLRAWLERSASIFARVMPGARDAPLVNSQMPGFTFDVVLGVSYRIDLSAPARHDAAGAVADPAACRIRDLCHQGRPVAADDRFVLVTSSHRLGGGGRFPLPHPLRELPLPPLGLRDALARADGPAAGPLPPGWSFQPLPGATALFDCAPQAVAPDTAIEPLGLTPAGFQRFRLHL